MNYRVYARASDPKQDKSVEQQLEVAEADLIALGYLPKGAELPRKHAPEAGVYVDDGISAWKVPPAERPGSRALLEDISANRRPVNDQGVIWVWAQSRMLRTEHGGAEAAAELLEFMKLGWTLYNHEKKTLLSLVGPERMLATLHIMLDGERDSDHSREKADSVRRAKQYQIRRGVWLGGFPPPGYDRWAVRLSDNPDPITGLPTILKWIQCLPEGTWNGIKGAETVLRPNDDANAVREFFRLVAHGRAGRAISLNDALRYLNSGDTPPLDPRTEKWKRSTIGTLLENETYIAVQRDDTTQPHRALWEPLIDRTTWDLVQRRQKINAALRRGTNSDYVLSGILFCGECHNRYNGCIDTSRGRSVRYYRSHSALRTNDPDRCPECRRRVLAELVEAEVLAAVGKLAEHPIVQAAIAAEREARAAGHDGIAARRDALEGALDDVRRQVRNLLPSLAMGGVVKEQVQQKLDSLNAEGRRIERELQALTTGHSVRLQDLVDSTASFLAIWQHAGPAERKDMLRCFVERVEIRRESRELRIGIRRIAGVGP